MMGRMMVRMKITKKTIGKKIIREIPGRANHPDFSDDGPEGQDESS